MALDGIFKKENKSPSANNNSLYTMKKGLSEIKQSIEGIKIPENIEVTNIDYIKLYLRDELTILAKKLTAVFRLIQPPSIIKVDGVTKLIETINDLRAIMAQIEFSPTITVEAPIIPEIKVPKLDQPIVKVEPQINVEPVIDLSELTEALKPLRYLSDKAGKPLSVQLSDGRRFIKALKDVVDKQERQITAFATSRGMDKDEFIDASKTVGSATHKDALTVADSAQEITISAGKTSIEVIPVGTSDVFYGGPGVTADDGAPVFSGKRWSNVKKGFKVSVVCAAGETCDTRIVEYD